MLKKLDLAGDNIGQLMASYCLPAIMGMLVQTLYNIIDRVFVGHIPKVGSLALTGVGITLPVMTLILGLGLLLGTGARARISLLLGQGKKEKAEELLGTMTASTAVISVVMAVIGIALLKPILFAFGANEATFPYAASFMLIIFLATPINMIGFTLNKVISPDGNPKIAMYTQFLGAGLNILLDPLLIFGCHLGVAGAALATALSQCVVLIWVWHYFTRSHKRTLTLYKENLRIHWEPLRLIMTLGMSAFFMQLAASLIQVIANRELAVYGGELAIGAMTIVQSVSLFFTQPLFGMNQGTQPIIGYNFAQQKIVRVKRVMKLAITIATLWAVLGWLLVLGAPQLIIHLFTNSPDMEHIATTGLRLFLGMLCVDGFQIVVVNFYQAIGNAKISLLLGVLRQWIILIPLLLILPHYIGINGVWLSGLLSDFGAFLITLVVYLCLDNPSFEVNKDC